MSKMFPGLFPCSYPNAKIRKKAKAPSKTTATVQRNKVALNTTDEQAKGATCRNFSDLYQMLCKNHEWWPGWKTWRTTEWRRSWVSLQSEVKAAEVTEDNKTRVPGPLCHLWQQGWADALELPGTNSSRSRGGIFSNTHLSKRNYSSHLWLNITKSEWRVGALCCVPLWPA